MIAENESLFVFMNALNQVCRRRRTEKILSYSHDVAGRVAASFSNTERFGHISLLHFFKDDAILFVHNFSSRLSHLNFQDDRSMSITYLLGRYFPYISMICWYAFLSSGTLTIKVGIKNIKNIIGIKNKSLEAKFDNVVNLNSSSVIDLSMKVIANICL